MHHHIAVSSPSGFSQMVFQVLSYRNFVTDINYCQQKHLNKVQSSRACFWEKNSLNQSARVLSGTREFTRGDVFSIAAKVEIILL